MNPPEADQRFIPYRKTDIVQMCCDDGHLSDAEIAQFRQICDLVSSIFHFRFHKTLEALKDCYAPVNPDADTKLVYHLSKDQRDSCENTLTTKLRELLNAANYEVITKDDLQKALTEESLFQIRLHVDFDDFEEILFFRRGMSSRRETLVRYFGLIKKPINFLNYDRVVVYVKFKDQMYFDQLKKSSLPFIPGSIIIKLFRNIPRADLEMLFPNSEVRMKTLDKLMIGVPAAIGGVVMLATKLGATVLLIGALLAFWIGVSDKEVTLDQTALLALAAGIGTLGGYLWKQFNNFKNRKIRFMKTLSENLYFKNLDNNAGVFHRLVDAAEEEEIKESILAYYFLLRAKKSMTTDELDRMIEDWFRDKYQHTLNFEIKDALNKLADLEIIEIHDGNISAVSLEQARINLDRRWDNYF